MVNALVAYRRLVEQGKAHLAFASPLAEYAARQVRLGRQIAEKMNVKDVSSRYCQQATGVRVQRLDRYDPQEECWRELLVEDHTAGPARIAAARIDFAAFMDSLSERERQIADALSSGESTQKVARQFRLTPGRISQLRRALLEKWRAMQGERPTLRWSAS